MIITQQLLDKLTAQAKENPRLLQSYDLRNTPEDDSQRMLNAIEPGSEMPIHRHKFTSETVVCLRGCLVEEFFDELERICTDRIELTPQRACRGGERTGRTVAQGVCQRVRHCVDGKQEWEVGTARRGGYSGFVINGFFCEKDNQKPQRSMNAPFLMS